MVIIFLQRFLENKNSGVNKKIIAQYLSLKNQGIPAKLVIINEFPPNQIENSEDISIIQIFPLGKDIISKFIHHVRVNAIIRNLVKSLNNDDILYTRYPYPSLWTYLVFRQKKLCKIVTEHQSFEINENLLIGDYAYLLNYFIFGKKILHLTNAIVGVTEEITQSEINFTKNKHKPHVTIGNGFYVNNVPMRSLKYLEKDSLQLLFIGNISLWHGLDRLINGLAAYKGEVRVNLHIVGEGDELPKIQKMVEKRDLSERVTFHGFKTGEALDNLFNTCHIAIGSLGIHRKGLTQTSELKVREYCARGIPWIIACKDPDFPDDYPYSYRIPPDDSPVQISGIIGFMKTVYEDFDHPQKMRAYASKNLDWSVKMKKLKSFLETLVDEPPS